MCFLEMADSTWQPSASVTDHIGPHGKPQGLARPGDKEGLCGNFRLTSASISGHINSRDIQESSGSKDRIFPPHLDHCALNETQPEKNNFSWDKVVILKDGAYKGEENQLDHLDPSAAENPDLGVPDSTENGMEIDDDDVILQEGIDLTFLEKASSKIDQGVTKKTNSNEVSVNFMSLCQFVYL